MDGEMLTSINPQSIYLVTTVVIFLVMSTWLLFSDDGNDSDSLYHYTILALVVAGLWPVLLVAGVLMAVPWVLSRVLRLLLRTRHE